MKPITPEDMFLEVFGDVRFPHFGADLELLREGLMAPTPEILSRVAMPLPPQGPRHTRIVSAMRAIFRGTQVPPSTARAFRDSESLRGVGLADRFDMMLRGPYKFAISEVAGRLEWKEESLWPLAYATLFRQFLSIYTAHETAIAEQIQRQSEALEAHGWAGENLSIMSQFPRTAPTQFHYAAASLGAWAGGSMNVQYFGYYATIQQVTDESLNLTYAERIGYSREDAEKMDASGLISLPVNLVASLVAAQDNALMIGSIPIDEWNLVNLPRADVMAPPKRSKNVELPGFVSDKNYGTIFRARKLDYDAALYGTCNVLRDHYEEFYAGLRPAAFVRCKHYGVPVVDVESLDELRDHAKHIPVRDTAGIFWRGQPCLYTLSRDPQVRRLLFGRSCSEEPSLTTTASRQRTFDYDTLHFQVRLALQQRIVERGGEGADGRLEAWREGCADPLCRLDMAVMALCQHYGVPTHGLDITLSDDVAAWFAVNRFHKEGGRCEYRPMQRSDWDPSPDKWPCVLAFQTVTNSIRGSLFDCEELAALGVQARRPGVQRARFFLGGHTDHQNRLAEALVCIFRLVPGEYQTKARFEDLFPAPEQDPAYGFMLELAGSRSFAEQFAPLVNRFH
jgi:FRG domain